MINLDNKDRNYSISGMIGRVNNVACPLTKQFKFSDFSLIKVDLTELSSFSG